MKTLIIDGTGRTEDRSKTKYLANRVIAKLDFANVEVVDLYNISVPFVTSEIIDSWKTDRNDTEALELLTQFETADRYVFIYPTWNWTVPAIVKAYLDLVLISGRTFGYDNRGKRVGYLGDKQAILISTTGGKSYSPLIAAILRAQDGDNYTVQMLKTMGIKNIKKYRIDNTAYDYNDESGKFSPAKYQARVQQLVDKIN